MLPAMKDDLLNPEPFDPDKVTRLVPRREKEDVLAEVKAMNLDGRAHELQRLPAVLQGNPEAVLALNRFGVETLDQFIDQRGLSPNFRRRE